MRDSRFKKIIRHPSLLLLKLSTRGIIDLSDKLYLKLRYLKKFDCIPDFDNPKTFNEKLQWLKLNDRKEIYTTMVDKYEAKEFISNIVGEKYIIPTYGIYDSFEEIDFDKLPNQFVMKCTHDSGGLAICNNKKNFDKEEARKKINKSLKNNFYKLGREWPYKNVKPRIIVEELLKNNDNSELIEYNFFCFNGVPKIIMLCHGDKRIKRYNDFYDMDFNKMDLRCEYANSDYIEKKPKQLEEMLNISKKLSKNTYFLRVDFYLVNNEVKVGELTFFHWAGFCTFDPEEYNLKLGNMINLPSDRKKKYEK